MIAANRRHRPGAGVARIEDATAEELESCPFCAGREDRTPPETLRIGDPWQVRVVPNLYPAFERQEVVIHSPRHVRSFAELSDDECALVAEAWQRRANDRRGRYIHAFVNEGGSAGASLVHSHSQLAWLPSVPAEARDADSSNFDDDLVFLERSGMQAAVARAGRAPYESVIRPLTASTWAYGDGRVADALQLLAEAIRRIRRIEGAIAWNAWLHAAPHWHIHVLPRLSVFAGLELGAGIYVNTLAPEDAAATLRAAL